MNTPPSRTLRNSPYGRRRYDFLCTYCGTGYDRVGRARDCRNADLGLTPYRCEGRCGEVQWFAFNPILVAVCSAILTSPAAYGSEKRWRRHLSPTVQCPTWYDIVTCIGNASDDIQS